VAAPEEIDITNAVGLRAVLLEVAARGDGTFVVDMSLTRFCDSSGLQALVAAHRRARAGDGEMLLVIPDAAVLRVFAITGMDQVIPNFASLAEALAQAAEGWSLADTGGERNDDAAISPVPSR
jgi:anti-sigma B factor antagonist